VNGASAEANVLAYRETKSLRKARRIAIMPKELDTNEQIVACARYCIDTGLFEKVDIDMFVYQSVMFCHAWAGEPWHFTKAMDMETYVERSLTLLLGGVLSNLPLELESDRLLLPISPDFCRNCVSPMDSGERGVDIFNGRNRRVSERQQNVVRTDSSSGGHAARLDTKHEQPVRRIHVEQSTHVSANGDQPDAQRAAMCGGGVCGACPQWLRVYGNTTVGSVIKRGLLRTRFPAVIDAGAKHTQHTEQSGGTGASIHG
jgi:hypothetical protein